VSRPTIKPWQVWWVDLDPTLGREQAKRRPGLVVSSATHLRLTGGQLFSIVPLTTVHRPGWLHRVEITVPGRPGVSYAVSEQVRTLSIARVVGTSPYGPISATDIAAVKHALRKMVDL
jgi:mRNA interferase MazF